MGGTEDEEGPCFAAEHRWVQQGKLRPRQLGSGNSSSQPQGILRVWGWGCVCHSGRAHDELEGPDAGFCPDVCEVQASIPKGQNSTQNSTA